MARAHHSSLAVSLDLVLTVFLNNWNGIAIPFQPLKKGYDMNPNDICWETGNYSDNCCCATCEHSHECSGSDADDDD